MLFTRNGFFVILVECVVANVVSGIVALDVDTVVTTSICVSGFDAINILISLKRFEWKSNCASAIQK